MVIEKLDGIDYFDKAFIPPNKEINKYRIMKSRPTKRPIKRSTKKTNIWIVEDNAFFQKCLIELINRETDLVCSQSFNSCEKTRSFATDGRQSITGETDP